MKLSVRSGRFEVTQSNHITLILDASESAEICRSEMVRLVSGLLAELPGWMTADVYFLGGAARFDGRLFSRNAPRWFAENRDRASMIAPTLEAIERNSGQPQVSPGRGEANVPISAGPVLIIGSGSIFDLEDWPGRDITLVSLGTTMLAGCADYREVFSPSPGDLTRLVHDPIVEACVTGDGFLPMDWDSSAFHPEISDGRFALVGSGGVGHASIAYASPYETDPGVTVTRESGRSEVIDLMPMPPDNQPIPTSGVLTEQESGLFRSAIAHERIDCPLCGGRHAWDTVRCMEVGVILGELIYQSIGDPDPGSVVVLREAPAGVEFRLRPRGVVVAGDGDAIIHGRSGTRLYAFDPDRRVWEEQVGKVEQYRPLSEGSHAIFV